MTEAKLRIRPFDKALHERSGFDSGVPAMDRWLRQSAGEQIRLNRLRLWCATDSSGAFVGYYALAMHAVRPTDAPNLAQRRERHAIPAIYLPALAVDRRHQRRGIGAVLLADAIVRAIAISKEIGAAAVILDVLKDEACERRRAFYANLGFAEIGNGDPARLYLSIRDAEAALATRRSDED